MGVQYYFLYCFLAAVVLPTVSLTKVGMPVEMKGSTMQDDDRIVGGEVTDITTTPHQVSVVTDNGDGTGELCGGSIISDEWIVTAAHCLSKSTTNNVKVRSGTNYWLGGDEHMVTEIIKHESYTPGVYNNDIACMKVDPPFKTDDSTSCIRFADAEPQDGALLRVCGWGATSEGGNISNDLLCTNVTKVSRDSCNQAYGGSITDNMFCAAEPGRDSCQGDSGGPITNLDDPLQLVGIVSFGIGCARPTHPGVYTNLANYHDWVAQNCGGNRCLT